MTDSEAALARMEAVATAMDSGVKLPVVGVKVGLDPLLGLVPVAGDLITAVVSLYVVFEAARAGCSTRVMLVMLVNVAVDTAAGAVPVVGDVVDVVWRANNRNVRLAKRDLGVA